MCTEYRVALARLPETQGNWSGDVESRLAGHDTGPQGARPPSATRGDSGLARRSPGSRGEAPSARPRPGRRGTLPPRPRRLAPPAPRARPCRPPEGAEPPPCPVVRRRRLVRSSSPRRVREREAVTFGASPAQGTGPRAVPASSHSRSAPRGTRPKAGPAGPLPGPRRAAGEPSRLTLALVSLPPSKMAAPTPATKSLSGGPGKEALHSALLLPTCGATGFLLLREPAWPRTAHLARASITLA
ncbi:uncharacterized protein [Canis lupus baileyi]|uniref:transcription initiation factor TFIID subunit 4-like n=1 Tax=Canis lupus dingo TaxID=286419 RepID=UPI0020C2DB70|nr:transcription initiation factor TFIID subunit 4-like [Canis lupus dingo]